MIMDADQSIEEILAHSVLKFSEEMNLPEDAYKDILKSSFQPTTEDLIKLSEAIKEGCFSNI
jgi:hypothetical protein